MKTCDKKIALILLHEKLMRLFFTLRTKAGNTLVELMLVSMITVFGALILFLLLSVTKTRSTDSINENVIQFNAFLVMKSVTKELKENAKSINYPDWNLVPSDRYINYTGMDAYSGIQYTGDIFLQSGKVYLNRSYQDGSQTSTSIGENIETLTFTAKNQNNRYFEIFMTFKIKNKTSIFHNAVTLRG